MEKHISRSNRNPTGFCFQNHLSRSIKAAKNSCHLTRRRMHRDTLIERGCMSHPCRTNGGKIIAPLPAGEPDRHMRAHTLKSKLGTGFAAQGLQRNGWIGQILRMRGNIEPNTYDTGQMAIGQLHGLQQKP